MNTLLLDALKCENQDRPPVWLMRQAGRFLPEYRALRAKHSLWTLFHTPELAAEVTQLPLTTLGVDAAILFSDILVIAEALGLKINFPESGGPFVDTPIRTREDIDRLVLKNVDETLSYVKQTILLLKPQLAVPLIGFCGAPFTVASYLIERKGKGDLTATKEWLYQDPVAFHSLLQKITEASIAYLRLQIASGVNAIQIFDSWAGVLSYPHFLEFSAAYMQKIIAALQDTQIPIILFCRGSSLFASELASLGAQAISFDWHQEMSALRSRVPPHVAMQGNLDPDLLKAPLPVIQKKVQSLLDSMQDCPGFIVNLGHGVLPDTPVDGARCLIETVKNSILTTRMR
jgi:uroporphyrinogen decarboxylase